MNADIQALPQSAPAAASESTYQATLNTIKKILDNCRSKKQLSTTLDISTPECGFRLRYEKAENTPITIYLHRLMDSSCVFFATGSLFVSIVEHSHTYTQPGKMLQELRFPNLQNDFPYGRTLDHFLRFSPSPVKSPVIDITLSSQPLISHKQGGTACSKSLPIIHPLLLRKDFSDIFLVTKDDRHLLAHKAILVDRSAYFHTMLCSGLKETYEETPELDFRDYSTPTVEAMLEYIYKGRLVDHTPVAYDDWAELLRLADQYQMPDLFVTVTAQLVNTFLGAGKVLALLDLGHKYRGTSSKLKDACIKFILTQKFDQDPSFAPWSETAERDLVVELVRDIVTHTRNRDRWRIERTESESSNQRESDRKWAKMNPLQDVFYTYNGHFKALTHFLFFFLFYLQQQDDYILKVT